MPAARAAATASIASRARRIGDADQAEQRQVASSAPVPDRDREHAQPARRQLRGRLARARRRRPTQRADDDLDRALDVEHAVGARIDIRLRSESNGVTVDARAARARSRRGGCPRSAASARIASSVGSPMPPRSSAPSSASQHAAAASSSARVIGAPQLAHGHHAGRQRPGLVGADHGRAAERLDRRQLAHQRVARRHAPHADRERDRDDRRQALGHRRDRERRPPRGTRRTAAARARARRPRRPPRSPTVATSSMRLTCASRRCSGVGRLLGGLEQVSRSCRARSPCRSRSRRRGRCRSRSRCP